MNERAAKPTADTVSKQIAAGHPDHSVWVSANAGSGKTHILTERVLRLLLSGVPPQNILCLTYTKAAAAEMQKRVGARLGAWALCTEAELETALSALSDRPALPGEVALARTLFALALETPGGLKINTIHAFCEAALHRFPLEADVPVDFSVIEDAEQSEMVRAARDRVLAEGLAGDGKIAAAVASLFSLMSDSQIEDAVNSALASGRQLHEALERPERTRKNLRNLVALTGEISATQIKKEGLAQTSLSQKTANNLLEITPPEPGKNRFEEKLARLDWARLSLEDLFGAFLTLDGNVPKRGFPKKIIVEKAPELAERLNSEAERLATLFGALKKIRLIERSEALLEVMAAIFKSYESAKRQRGVLDFYDLISRFEKLLSREGNAQWVRYKLDSGITHILVDESQDTNPGQWNVVRLLADDFFDGDSAVERPRTLFAVGDEKQSIYSFQGADPVLFAETGCELGLRAMSAEKIWKDIRFRASFRTLENILEGVDLICARPDIKEALLSGDTGVLHESARVDKGGAITLWPPVEIEKVERDNSLWPLAPLVSLKTAPRALAERIARQIGHWLATKRPLAARRRAIRPGDILILVQSRGPVFKEIIRALKRAGIPTPGADRLPVSEHIVVRDLLILGEVLLSPHDDLALATLLRSPLFGLSESQLEELCIGRRKKSVWQELIHKATKYSWAKSAFAKLEGWRQRLDFDRPYEFFAQALFVQDGLKQFHGRLGDEIDDVIGEFMDLALAHEQSEQPSLQGFLASMRKRDISIKRELSEAGGGVRVMSVHGAKGLEAPVVILADATSASIKTGPVYLKGAPNPIFLHASSKNDHVPETLEDLRQPDVERQSAEYWRKLYVAMTRAEDELYISGTVPEGKKAPDDCWYGAAHVALHGQSCEVEIAGEKTTGLRYPAVIPAPLAAEKIKTQPPLVPLPVTFDPLDPQETIEIVRPSGATSHQFDADTLLQGATAKLSQTAPAKKSSSLGAIHKGNLLHLLLQYLAPIAESERRKIGQKALDNLLPDRPADQSGLIEQALAILSGPDSALIFGEGSRAELPIFVNGFRGDKSVQLIGRIDRIIVREKKVLVVDFKSDAQPAATAEEIQPGYLTQLGLYLRGCEKLFPHYEVSAALYWTSHRRLMYVARTKLIEATSQFKFP